MTHILEIMIAVLLVLGGVFGLIGSYGLLRLRDPMRSEEHTSELQSL